MNLAERILERATRAMPGPIGARIDALQPSLSEGFGGPFNGQERRAETVAEMFAAIPFAVVIETGTYRATTTLLLGDLTSAPVATIEANSRYYHYARKRLASASNITVLRGESPAVLRSIGGDPRWNRGPAFFYLDAHWRASLPLVGELEEIARLWRDYAVLIDDFRVEGDPGYAYDDYGPEHVLELPIFVPLRRQPVQVFWPSSPSDAETGARRGWIVLATPGLVTDRLLSVTGLRSDGSLAGLLARTMGDHE